ncbi:MAG: hypothetical protein BGN89_11440 [Alphaproteobacteria bacterium 64-6]|nr:MAG: hypothetical protein BGN89_11440 [Alphaproteobacteria bacterium 64-6]
MPSERLPAAYDVLTYGAVMAAAVAAVPAMKRRREILFLGMLQSSQWFRHERDARDLGPPTERRQRADSMRASIDGRTWRFLRRGYRFRGRFLRLLDSPLLMLPAARG